MIHIPHIKGMELYQLLNARPIVKSALDSWSNNDFDKPKEEVEYNIGYFREYLKMIDLELNRIGYIKPIIEENNKQLSLF